MNIRCAPRPRMLATGDGLIKKLSQHLMSLEDGWLKEDADRCIQRISVKPFEIETVLWNTECPTEPSRQK